MVDKWIEKYWNYMIKEDFENALPLRNKHFPSSFFKYRKLSEHTIDSIKENYIWLADISSLNDPFECSIQFNNDECLREYFSSDEFSKKFNISNIITKKEIKSLAKSNKPFRLYRELCKKKNIPFNMSEEEQINKIQRGWSKTVDETNQKLRICSFCLINDSLLLWSHYSDEHKGICIEYDFRDTGVVCTFIQPVNYKNEIFKIGLSDIYSVMRMIGSSLMKSTDWRYEQEWRVTIFKQKDYFPQRLTVQKPKAIYLVGTRFHLNDAELKIKLLDIAKEREIPIYYMDKHPNEYKLIDKKYNR